MRGRKPVVKPLSDDDVIDLPSAMDRIPEPPARLKGLARELWPSVVAEVVARNIYDGDCREVTMQYCVQYARFLQAEEQIAKLKRNWTVMVGDHEAVHPLFKISNDACSLMLRIGTELGLSAASRKRVVKVRGGTKAAAGSYLDLKRA